MTELAEPKVEAMPIVTPEMAAEIGFDDEDIRLLSLSEEEEMQLGSREWLLSALAHEHLELVNQRKDYRPGNTKRPSRSMRDLDWSSKKNWVDKKGVKKAEGRGLPIYIERIARQLTYAKKMPRPQAIATAINTVKRWCNTGRVTPGSNSKVNSGSRSQACAALKQWNQMKARA